MKKISLLEADMNKKYLIADIMLSDKDTLRRLTNLKIEKNRIVTKINKSYKSKSFIIKVLGINYAVGRNLCEKILVYDEE